MLILHTLMICPNCGQEVERFDIDADGTEIMCDKCRNTFVIGIAKEIQIEY